MAASKPIVVFGSTGDLGSHLLVSLNSQGYETICPVRHPLRTSLTLPHSDANRFVPFPSKKDIFSAVTSLIENSAAVINCTGVLRSNRISQAAIRNLYYVNSLLPILISAATEEANIPTIHCSTGDLDRKPLLVPAPRLLACLHKLRRGARTRSLRDNISVLIESIDPCLDHYAMSKLAQEEFVRLTKHSKSIRISNFFGPGYLGQRLIPRLIENRIRGARLLLHDEKRNYICKDQLNAFFCCVVMHFSEINSSVLWCYGHATKRVKQIAKEIDKQLPACYGEVAFRSPTNKDIEYRSVKTVTDYFPQLLRHQLSFSEEISETIKFWRRGLYYDFPTITASGKRNVSRIAKGGSIAQKLIHNTSEGNSSILEKTAADSGYEGAGAPKLRSELKYYQFLKTRKRLSNLLTHYVPLVGFKDTTKRISLFFDYCCDGQSIAERVLGGATFPRSALYRLIRETFEAGYFSDLRAVSMREGVATLRYYYLDRALDRVAHFLLRYEHRHAPPEIRHLFGLVAKDALINIDSISCKSPFSWLREIERSERLSRYLAPRAQGFCSHGDLTILNILMEANSDRLLLIDPRGHVGAWDPTYDLGKLIFSLSGFSHVILAQFEYALARDNFVLHPEGQPHSLRVCLEERTTLLRWLMRCPTFAKLRMFEANLYHRILFAEAVHYLADIPYRFALAREYHNVGAVLLLGIKYLDAAMREIVRITEMQRVD